MNRRETLDHRRKQDRRIGANPQTRAEDVAERAVQAVEEVPDTIDSLNKEAKCTRPVFAEPGREAESPDKMPQELATRMRRRARAILTARVWKERRC